MARCCSTSEVARDIGLLLIRVPLGALFLYAGYFKCKIGVANFATSSFAATKPFMPESLGWAFLYALPAVELAVGAMLVLGLLARIGGLLGTLLLISIMMAVTWAKSQAPDAKEPFDFNIILAGIAAGVLFCGPGRISIDALLFKCCGTCKRDEKTETPGGPIGS